MSRSFWLMGLGLMLAVPAAAQPPTLTLGAEISPPGVGVAATITGIPGRNYVLIGSTVGAGFVYAGVPLAVGTDVVIHAMGTLDGTGQAVIPFIPPFSGTTLDRYYVQAVTSTNASFIPPEGSAGRIVRNADLLGNLPFSDTLPSGKTVRGAYSVGGRAPAIGDLATTALSFTLAPAAAPVVHIVLQGGAAPVECPGTAQFPLAAPGHLCVYEELRSNSAGPTLLKITRAGAVIVIGANAAGAFGSFGTWAMTAQ